MAKSKKIKEELVENQPIVEQIVDEGQSESITNDEHSESIDPKKQILIEYADFWNSNELSRKATVRMEVGRQIWDFWQRYTERNAQFSGCSSCVPPKVKYLAKECERYGVELH